MNESDAITQVEPIKPDPIVKNGDSGKWSDTDYLFEFRKSIESVTAVIGKPLDSSKYTIIDRGSPHKPVGLPRSKMGVYVFWYDGQFLKIGKAGPNSSARFLSQHYGLKAPSTLAKSILNDANMTALGINEANVSEWIKSNCRRIDVIIDVSAGIFTLELIEGILHYAYEPKYEGFHSQRLIL